MNYSTHLPMPYRCSIMCSYYKAFCFISSCSMFECFPCSKMLKPYEQHCFLFRTEQCEICYISIFLLYDKPPASSFYVNQRATGYRLSTLGFMDAIFVFVFRHLTGISRKRLICSFGSVAIALCSCGFIMASSWFWPLTSTQRNLAKNISEWCKQSLCWQCEIGCRQFVALLKKHYVTLVKWNKKIILCFVFAEWYRTGFVDHLFWQILQLDTQIILHYELMKLGLVQERFFSTNLSLRLSNIGDLAS